MTDTNNTTATDPQDLINAALGTATPTTTPTPAPNEPTLTPPSEPETMPTELTEAPPLPTTAAAPQSGEELPLAFAAEQASTPTPTTTPIMESLGTSAPMDAVPTVPPVLTPTENALPKRHAIKSIIVGLSLFIALLGGVGLFGYQKYGSIQALIAGVLNPDGDCPKGYHVRPSDGKCVVNDIKGGGEEKEKDKIIENASSRTECESSGGGQWCESDDSNGKHYAFCMKNDGTQGNCNNRAAEKGYVIQQGIVKCVQREDGTFHADRNYEGYQGMTLKDWDDVEQQCVDQLMGTGAYICPVGTGVACTDKNGIPFNGNLGCFCGVVQIDTGTGHVSYKSSCGCEKEPTPKPSPVPSPSASVTPKLMCDSITRTPTTTPKIGDKLTFTCAGSSVPAGSIALNYKFRYAIDNGTWNTMTNKTTTTSELTINACGTYKIECQACGTISGSVVCDPAWTGATLQ